MYVCALRHRDPVRVKVLENYCALATRQKMHVERAMQSFGEILEGDPEYLPAVLGMATGFMIEKNQVLHAPTSFFDCDATFEPLELWNALTA